VASLARATAIEAVEADLQAGRVVLCCVSGVAEARVPGYGEIHTMESKHWVQSSRYTDCDGPGGRSSGSCQQLPHS